MESNKVAVKLNLYCSLLQLNMNHQKYLHFKFIFWPSGCASIYHWLWSNDRENIGV